MMHWYLATFHTHLSALLSHQIAMTVETLHLFLVIWSPNHGEAVIAELVRAILQDESLKMRRLAALFSIDVKSLDTMIVIRSGNDAERILYRSDVVD